MYFFEKINCVRKSNFTALQLSLETWNLNRTTVLDHSWIVWKFQISNLKTTEIRADYIILQRNFDSTNSKLSASAIDFIVGLKTRQ